MCIINAIWKATYRKTFQCDAKAFDKSSNIALKATRKVRRIDLQRFEERFSMNVSHHFHLDNRPHEERRVARLNYIYTMTSKFLLFRQRT